MKRNKLIKLITSILIAIMVIISCFITYRETGKIDKEEIKESLKDVVEKIEQYNMTDEEIEQLPTTEIVEQTEEQEKATSEEQKVEGESFELQGNIAYNGTTEFPSIKLGDYSGLTYYSQIDSRWSSHSYTSVGNYSQTIGSSGCGPTSAAMIVTAIKGTITPPEMGDLFVKYGYRTSNNGTYFSAFRFVADTFDIDYVESYHLDDVVDLLRNNHYVIVSCGNGLFTTGGHFIVITGIEGDTLKIYDPYLYSGKFESSTRRGKVTVDGNTVYCSIDNFRNYANYTKFFCYKHNGQVQVNNVKPVTTQTYARYVKVNTSLNVRNAPGGSWIGSLKNGTQVTVYETNGTWSRIDTNKWVSSLYLVSNNTIATNYVKTYSNSYTIGKYRVNASVLNVRTGPGTNYKAKRYYELTPNARSQNSRLGGYYTNGLRRGVITTVTEIKNGFGKTPSGYISLQYCSKI